MQGKQCRKRTFGYSSCLLLFILLWLGLYAYSYGVIETVEVDCSNSRCFLISLPNIQSDSDLELYVDTTLFRLNYLDSLGSYKAMITFRRPMNIEELSNQIGSGTGSVKYVTETGEAFYFPCPFQDEDFNETPDSTEGFVSAYVTLPALNLIALSSSEDVVAVDPGPVEVMFQYFNPEIIVATDVYGARQFFPKSSPRGRESEIPSSHYLDESFPNPFNSTCKIEYGLAENALVTIVVYDILGREVRALVHEFQNAGRKSTWWDGKDNTGATVTSGIYLSVIKIGEFTQSRKMTLLK